MTGQHTPLFQWHQAHGATFAEFGGFDMPLWYQSAKNEHLSVLTSAGLFDTSHMSAIRVSGPDAAALLQQCFSNNLDACIGPSKTPLVPGRCVYGAFLNEKGHVIDDAICFMLAADAYFVVVNAGMGAKLTAHLENHRGIRDVGILNLDGSFGKMDVQGPLAATVLASVLDNAERVLEKMPYFSFRGGYPGLESETVEVRLKNGTPILLSRTGYTGEFGFELFTAAAELVSVWESVFAAGEKMRVVACGLAARDSLRTGAVLPLSHQDIGDRPFVRHPWPFALAWAGDGRSFTKSFIGDRALLEADDAGFTYPFLGADLRKVVLPATAFDGSGKRMGVVLTCVTDMGIGRHEGRVYSIASPDKPEDYTPKGLCCGFVLVDHPLEPGSVLELRDERRKLKVTIVEDIRPDRTARRPIKDMF